MFAEICRNVYIKIIYHAKKVNIFNELPFQKKKRKKNHNFHRLGFKVVLQSQVFPLLPSLSVVVIIWI